MSALHPIISVTGASGDGTQAVWETFEHIFEREKVRAAAIEGPGFRRYDRVGMEQAMRDAIKTGNTTFSHFGADANLLQELESSLRSYAETGRCRTRAYAETADCAARLKIPEGTFSNWSEVGEGTDLLLYQGLHGALVTERANIAQHADLRIGVVPVINLEWIEKIHRDKAKRGSSTAEVTAAILRRMQDYITCISPQFSHTDINFQRVPIVDTSNPFIARWIPSADETMVVIRFRNPSGIDFPYLLSMIHDSFMSRANSIVVPGGKLDIAMQVILTPLILKLVDRRRRVLSL